MKELKGRVAVVTGASRGIGRHIALALGREGAKLVLVARSVDALHEVAEDLRARLGVEVIVVATDLAKVEQIDQLIEKTHKK